MKLYKNILLSFVTIASLNATTLNEIIDSTLNNNQNIKSLKLQNSSLEQTKQAYTNSYYPTLNLGANYLKLDGDMRDTQIGQTTTAFAKFSIDLYNGGKNEALKKQKEYEYKSAKNQTKQEIRKTMLQVVTLYFNAKTIDDNIKVLKEKAIALKAQYERVKIRYDLKMTTIDEVLKLQSEYESNNYEIEDLKYQKEQNLQNLELVSNMQIKSFDTDKLSDIKTLNYTPSYSIKSLQNNILAKDELKNITKSEKSFQVKVEDTYNIYDYDDYNQKFAQNLPKQQNQLMLSVNYKLFDTSTDEKTQAVRLAKLSLVEQLKFTKRQEKINFKLSKKKLEIQKAKINSLKSAVKMAKSVYDMTKIKYENGVVDNIAYLDALSKKAYYLALFQQSLNDYEIAKANYYFNSGVEKLLR